MIDARSIRARELPQTSFSAWQAPFWLPIYRTSGKGFAFARFVAYMRMTIGNLPKNSMSGRRQLHPAHTPSNSRTMASDFLPRLIEGDTLPVNN